MAPLAAARRRHDAERAVLLAALHHGDERLEPRARPPACAVIFTSGPSPVSSTGRRSRRTRATSSPTRAIAGEPNTRSTYGARSWISPLLELRHAAHHADHEVGPSRLSSLQLAELREHLLLRLLADRARVQEDHVGVARAIASARTDRARRSPATRSESYSFIWQPYVMRQIDMPATLTLHIKFWSYGSTARGGKSNERRGSAASSNVADPAKLVVSVARPARRAGGPRAGGAARESDAPRFAAAWSQLRCAPPSGSGTIPSITPRRSEVRGGHAHELAASGALRGVAPQDGRAALRARSPSRSRTPASARGCRRRWRARRRCRLRRSPRRRSACRGRPSRGGCARWPRPGRAPPRRGPGRRPACR